MIRPRCDISILSSRRQAEIWNDTLAFRLEHLLSRLMEREGFDAWIVAAREYNEGPLLPTFLPEPMMTARRLTILLFLRKEDGSLERLSFSPPYPELAPYYRPAWSKASGIDQWDALAGVLQKSSPSRIGINVSQEFAFGDGLSVGLFRRLEAALEKAGGIALVHALASAESLAVAWLETRTAPELERYGKIVALAHRIIDEAFSPALVHPGVTSTDDIAWWIRERIETLGLSAWFMPTVDLQRRGSEDPQRSGLVIQGGDLLHCDVGLRYLGLCTDTQKLAYVLKEGESCAPEGILSLVKEGNRLQDLLTDRFVAGRSGNEILLSTLKAAEDAGMEATVYTHPIGFHGHGAGPTIGLYNQQETIPVKGDYPLYNDTCYAIELNAALPIAEWEGQKAYAFLEQTAAFTGGKVVYFDGRQTEPILV
ncbi:M24 family metallopeptidase [Sediminispirochaeta smaragdinae]|jgi:Xaa-Pro aminopeptidase|uniref:Xaa-Pro aminopeptidase family enzyme n=1 Tax=Sediminispirochaeta smaragdinae (strain DSM 11293 / JCM 15392 / SEBR 4228) TaxID=573413 RepID=E1R9P8_SEDSS|nr:M24 family metallopeptidase [Sediminispirochaeta smaragdinae]ADK83217.1 Xaa-Pro aminopeptidase family enzyme [Sediminispirochaeta smaragdinae DSM 11293]